MASGFDVIPREESGGDAKAELVTDASKLRAETVAGPLIPADDIAVASSIPVQAEGEASRDDSGLADVDCEPDQLLEANHAPSRSISGSSGEVVSDSEVTTENVRALKKTAKRGKRYSDACELKIKELEEKLNKLKPVQYLDPADSTDHLSVPVQSEQNGISNSLLVSHVPSVHQQMMAMKNRITSLKSELDGLRKLLSDTQQQLKTAQQRLKATEQQLEVTQQQHETAQQRVETEREAARREIQKQYKENRKVIEQLSEEKYQNKQKIQQLEGSVSRLEEKLKDKEQEIELLLDEDKFDHIYSFFEGKSSTVVDGDRCIICDEAPSKVEKKCIHGHECRSKEQPCDHPVEEHKQTCLGHKFKPEGKSKKSKSEKCIFMKQDGQPCDRPVEEHEQSRLDHRFIKPQERCSVLVQNEQLCDRPKNEHEDLGHSFKALSLCQSHLYPRCVLEVVCEGKNSWIYDGKSCTPESCKRRLICCLCEPATSELENCLYHRFVTKQHRILPKDTILFSILAYRAMLFKLHHFSYRNKCCGRHRANTKAILQYGWRCNDHLRSSRTCDITPPALLYFQSPVELSSTLHFPTVCELDFTVTDPTPPPELGDRVLAIYGCIPPYHYVLLRDPEAERHLQQYSRQIVLSINKRLSKELKKLYEINDKAKTWLQGICRLQGMCRLQETEFDEQWWPVLTFGHLKCCLKIRVK